LDHRRDPERALLGRRVDRDEALEDRAEPIDADGCQGHPLEASELVAQSIQLALKTSAIGAEDRADTLNDLGHHLPLR
jgi:hypothetical protein